MLVLAILMQGIIQGGNVRDDTAEILSRIWIAGVIPLFVGIALIINGVFVSKKIVEAANRESLPARDPNANLLHPQNAAEFVPRNLSVTEETTRHLR